MGLFCGEHSWGTSQRYFFLKWMQLVCIRNKNCQRQILFVEFTMLNYASETETAHTRSDEWLRYVDH